MKRLVSLTLALCLSLLAGCAGASSSQAPAVSEAAPASSLVESAPEASSEPAAASSAASSTSPSVSSSASNTAVPSSSEAPASAAAASVAASVAAPVESSTEAEPTSSAATRAIALKGPTTMGMVQMMKEKEGDAAYRFSIAANLDEVTPKLVQGSVDIAAVPANLASVLYHNTKGKVQVIGINTLGVLYIVESGDSIQSISDLKGKTIYASGKGAVPEYSLNYILEKNKLTPGKDVTIEWKSEPAECVALLAANENGIAMLPQPFVTTAQAKNSDLRIALDLNAEWDAVQKDEKNPGAMLTGVVVARTEFIEQNPEALDDFLNSYGDSVEFVNDNNEEAAALIEEYGIVPAAVAEKALPYCNIVLIESTDMKEMLSGYLSVLFAQNPKSIGGALPGDDFYYGV